MPIKRSPTFELAAQMVRRLVEEQHDRPSLVTAMACEIGAEIIEGIRAPGEDLNSVALARRFQSSRTPVREALMLLQKEGLVDIPPRRRPRVASLDLENIREIYRTRSALYEHIAADIARAASVEEIASLRLFLDRMREARDANRFDDYVWANVGFFDRITEIAHNRTVKRILDSLLLRTLPLRRHSLLQPARLARAIEDYARLVRAYEDRDANLAAALLRSNNVQALSALEAHFAVAGVPAPPPHDQKE